MATRKFFPLFIVLLVCVTASAEDAKAPPKKKVEATAQVKKVGVAQVAINQKLAEAQKVAIKKLTEAEKEQVKAAKNLSEATEAAAKAEGNEAKAAAAKQLELAKKQAEEAKKAVEARRNELKKLAAAQAAARRAVFTIPTNLGIREDADPQDPIEKLAVLTPSGPLVVQVAMTMNGKPFRMAREKLIDEMIAAADTNKDGEPTWDEALKTSRFTLGRVRISNDEQRKQYLKALDKNENGLVERSEARLFVGAVFRTPSFLLSGYGYYSNSVAFGNGQATYRGNGQADVQTLLDQDKDGNLSEKEIASASERLKSRDTDDNDLLYPQELRGTPQAARGNQAQVRRAVARPQAVQLAILLGESTKADALFTALQTVYKNKEGEILARSFSAVPKLFDALDKNKDGKLQQNEVGALNDFKPHVELNVGLGKSDATGVTVKSISPELAKPDGSAGTVSIEFPGIQIAFAANLAEPRVYDYSRTAATYLMRYDKDSNGYLEKKELPANFVRQIELWDGNNDGRVYAKEIVASYTRMLAPQMSQIRARVTSSNQGNSLFQALDQSGDQRLSLREMRTAAERLKAFDENKDGQITLTEIPVTLSVHFALGNASYTYARRAQGTGASPTPKGSGPDWFTRMDRNGDGDLTLKEFIGSKEAFDKLDANRDGFIEPKEAKAADVGSKSKNQ